MRFIARDAEGRALADETWLSIGGGFIIRDGAGVDGSAVEAPLPYPFRSGAELLARGRESGLSIAELDAGQRGGAEASRARRTPMPRGSSTSCSPASTGA